MRHAARLGATSLVLGCLVAAATPASGTGLLDAEIGAAHESNVNLTATFRTKLPLYAGTPAHPVVFDRAGVVTIGCNIHDWMIAHIYVADSAHHGKTDRHGRVSLTNVPAGRYTVRVWHPRMAGAEASTRQSATIETSGAVDLTWKLTLNPELRPRRSPVPGQRGYR